MFYTIIIIDDGEILTYTFHPERSSKTGNDSLGLSVFTNAIKKYYSGMRHSVTMTIMNSYGEYLHTNGSWKQNNIRTYKEWTTPLTEVSKQEIEEYHALQSSSRINSSADRQY